MTTGAETVDEEKVVLTMNENQVDAASMGGDSIDGRDHHDAQPNFTVTTAELRDLMELLMKHSTDQLATIAERYHDMHGLARKLRTSVNNGIPSIDVEHRRTTFGKNFIEPQKSKSFWRLVWEALKDTILQILVVAAIISLILGMAFESVETGWIEPFAILFAVMVVSLVTALNDWQKDKQFRELQSKISSSQSVALIRDGIADEVLTSELVVGDIVQLKYGDLIPADALVIQSSDLKVNEAALTGESDDVKKSEKSNPALFSGTHVMEGSCKCLITAVGLNSQSGVIFSLIAGGKSQEHAPASTATNGPVENGSAAGDGKKLHQPPAEDGMSEVDLTDGGKQAKKEKKTEKEQEDSEDEEKSILQNKLTKLTMMIAWLGVGAALITTLAILIRFCIETYVIKKEGWDNVHLQSFLKAFITGVTIMVVAIPEGLPLAVTIALAYSVKRMLLDNNLVRHLDACETMGNATTICSDKTGTLTTNRMTVVESYLEGTHYKETPDRSTIRPEFLDLLCRGISINSSYSTRIGPPEVEGGLPQQLGNKTECALLGFLYELGESYDPYRDEVKEEDFTHVYTFNSVRKSMSTAVPLAGGGFRLYQKGASEMVLSRCTSIIKDGGLRAVFTRSDADSLIRGVIEPMASNGLRTIGLAYRDFPVDQGVPDWDNEEEIVSNLTCIGIVGIEDPVRPEVPPSIVQCQHAGITVRMVTGDNINTARSIAIKCGIITPDSDFLVLEGREFNERVRDENGVVQQSLLDAVWPQLRVMARSSPQDKYTLVKGIIDSKASKSREIVAVTGDGTNDGPALKMADVGFAMGIQGTDVAKEASDIILTDDNFTSIVKAVMWGRNVYDSISKFIQFQLTVNLVAILTCIIGALALQATPLTSIQLLWVNLIMDTFASLALATELPTPDLLERKPYGRTKPLIGRSMIRFIIGHSIYQLIVLLLLCFWASGEAWLDVPYGFGGDHGAPPTQHNAIIFNTFVMMQVFNEINARKVHGERNVFKGITTNKLFLVILVGTFLVQILLVECAGRAFNVTGLSIEQWMWCIFLGFSELLVHQLVLCVPLSIIPKSFRLGSKGLNLDQTDGMGRVLWMRSLNRLQSQMQVVNAFRTNLDPSHRTLNVISPAVINSLLVPISSGMALSPTVQVNSNATDKTENVQHVDAL